MFAGFREALRPRAVAIPGWPRAWSRDWGGLVTAAFGVYTLLFMLWFFFRWGGEEAALVIANLAPLPMDIAGAVLAWRAATHAALDTRTRTAWRLLAAALLATFIGNLLWSYQELVLGVSPSSSWADVAYLAFYPLLLWGLLSIPSALPSREQRVRFALDAGTVLLGGGLVVWHLVLRSVALGEYATSVDMLLALAYPLGDLVILLGITTVALRPLPAVSRGALVTLASALVVSMVANVAYGHMTLQGPYPTGSWPDLNWIVAAFLVIVSAQWQYWRAGRAVGRPGEERATFRPLTLLPYLAIAAGYGLLLAVASELLAGPLGNLILGALGLTGLVVARQVTVLRENGRLLAESRTLARDNARLYHETQHAFEALRQSQAQLVQAAKLAAVGTLAAGVAHELNQSLMVIRGQTQMLQMTEAPPAERVERLDRIERQTGKMSAIIDHLRAFGRVSPDGTGEPVDLNRVVAEGLLFIEGQLRERGITLVLDLAAAPTHTAAPVALADANQVEQVLLNLLVNARDALGGGGMVRLRTWQDQAGCHLTVADDGPGLPGEIQERVFEPFFTTKAVGQGTGLGLAISREIARRWGGELTLANRTDGRGAIAHLLLPVADAERPGPAT
jgi:signal transduction histidine kinase